MTYAERAVQMISVLMEIGKNPNRLTNYGELHYLTGYATRGIAHPLGYILRWCEDHNLPPLTSLVVSKRTGLPGMGYGKVTKTVWLQQIAALRALIVKGKWPRCPSPATVAASTPRRRPRKQWNPKKKPPKQRSP